MNLKSVGANLGQRTALLKRVLVVLAAAVVAVVAFFVLSVSRYVPKVAAASCSNASLSGSYGGYGWGSQSGTLDNSVVVYNFSGTGTYTGSYWEMYGGSASSGSLSGNYSIGSNCEGTLYNPTTGATYDHVVVVSSGAEADLVNNASGAQISTVLKKQ
jgi:hypothetical protein